MSNLNRGSCRAPREQMLTGVALQCERLRRLGKLSEATDVLRRCLAAASPPSRPLPVNKLPVLPAAFGRPELIQDGLFARWVGQLVAGNRAVQARASSWLTQRLLEAGVPRNVHGHETPGPCGVAVFGWLLESQKALGSLWAEVARHLSRTIRPSDASFLGLFFAPTDLAELTRQIPGDSNELRNLIVLSARIAQFVSAEPGGPFPTGAITAEWFDAPSGRGLRRSHARRLGLRDGEKGVSSWPSWLDWSASDPCPIGLVAVATEWFLASLRVRSASERFAMVGTPLVPQNREKGTGRVLPGVAPPAELERLLVPGRDDGVAAWIEHDLAQLFRADLHATTRSRVRSRGAKRTKTTKESKR